MRIAYQGEAGAFGHEACFLFMPDCEPMAQPSFRDVPAAVLAGKAERGVLPLANSIAGPVPGNAELLDDERLEAIRAFTLQLLASTGAVGDDELEAFVAHGYTPRNALEVVLGIGTYTMSTFANRLVRA